LKLDHLLGDTVRITLKAGEVLKMFVWGLRFEDETEEETLEMWTEGYVVPIKDIASIEKIVPQIGGYN
jgi:hypothetical protein